MSSQSPQSGVNSWLEDELYQQYLRDRSTVDETWKKVFEANGRNGSNGSNGLSANGVAAVAPPAMNFPGPPAATGEGAQPMRGAAARIAANMSASLSIPLATSQRIIPVKVMDENRRIINQHRVLIGQSKVSYTHIIGWAVVKALGSFPTINNAYAEQDGAPFHCMALIRT